MSLPHPPPHAASPAAYDLDTCLIDFSSKEVSSFWTIREAVEGVQIFGGIGSGKTSGSGKLLAKKYLQHGFGGLVLTAKSDEKNLWLRYCKEAGRLDDLIIIEPGGQYHFNFLQYEAAKRIGGVSITDNLLQVLKTVIRSSEEKSGGKSDDPFWETALDMLIFNVIDLCLLAYDTLSVEMMYNIVLTAPKRDHLRKETPRPHTFDHAMTLARNRVNALIDELENGLTAEEREKCSDTYYFEVLLFDRIPEAKLLQSVDQFFLDHYRNLSEKTRSIIEFSFSGFLFRLLKEPVFSLFCKYPSNVTPDQSLEGKIILLNLPVKLYHKVGRDCQVLFKYIWQRAMESRDIQANGRPVFLFADESQHFIHEYDAEYQATARSSRIATVYISQNIPNYHANMGGLKSEYRVKSFLGTLGTKIFHANADIETNTYASDLIGEAYTESVTVNTVLLGDRSVTENKTVELEKMVRPEQFASLQTGGPDNGFIVEGYVHRQGRKFHDGQVFRKIKFNQQ